MNEIVECAVVLAPVATAGVTAAGTAVGQALGKDAYGIGREILRRISFRTQSLDVEEVRDELATALEEGVNDKEISRADLLRLLAAVEDAKDARGQAIVNTAIGTTGTTLLGNTITAGGSVTLPTNDDA